MEGGSEPCRPGVGLWGGHCASPVTGDSVGLLLGLSTQQGSAALVHGNALTPGTCPRGTPHHRPPNTSPGQWILPHQLQYGIWVPTATKILYSFLEPGPKQLFNTHWPCLSYYHLKTHQLPSTKTPPFWFLQQGALWLVPLSGPPGPLVLTSKWHWFVLTRLSLLTHLLR